MSNCHHEYTTKANQTKSQASWLKCAQRQVGYDNNDNADDDGTEATYCDSESDSESGDDHSGGIHSRSSSSSSDDDDDDDAEAKRYFVWRHWEACFRESTSDLLSDDVDPEAELHMKFPGAAPPARMPPFSFYCQSVVAAADQKDQSDSNKNNDTITDELDALDFFSEYPVLKQERPHQQHQKKKASKPKQPESLLATRFLLHRFARC